MSALTRPLAALARVGDAIGVRLVRSSLKPGRGRIHKLSRHHTAAYVSHAGRGKSKALSRTGGGPS